MSSASELGLALTGINTALDVDRGMAMICSRIDLDDLQDDSD